jgi:hypothetical protein
MCCKYLIVQNVYIREVRGSILEFLVVVVLSPSRNFKGWYLQISYQYHFLSNSYLFTIHDHPVSFDIIFYIAETASLINLRIIVPNTHQKYVHFLFHHLS